MTIIGSILETARRQWTYHRAKAELKNLDERTLRDIGVSRGDIDRIAWQAAQRPGTTARRPGAFAGFRAAAQH